MRMRNPFSGAPGEGDEGDAQASFDPLDPPGDEGTPDEEPAGAEVSETHADDGPDEESTEAVSESTTADSSADKGRAGEQNISAPSIGPNTVIERKPPEQRLDHDKISDTDALGRDKRREVVGGTYGPTRVRVFATFATFFAVVAALTVGFYFLAKELDAPPDDNPDVAPWSQADAPQKPPKPLQ